MWKRLPAPSRRRAVWLANEDADEQLDQLPLTMYAPNGTEQNPYPLLKGRPVVTAEQCPQLGTLGDIVLADLSQYILIDGGLTPMLSVHARFDSDQVIWRFVLRIDGKGNWSSPITPYNGGATRSPFVALAAR
jgi:HK97 family phage major capsid protein